MKEQLLKAQQLRQKLEQIIDIASKVEHKLANRLRAIQQSIVRKEGRDTKYSNAELYLFGKNT